jgi:hypothetical protein
MRFSLVCISSIALRSTMDQSGFQRTSFQFSIDAYRPMHVSKPGFARKAHWPVRVNREADSYQFAQTTIHTQPSWIREDVVAMQRTTGIIHIAKL